MNMLVYKLLNKHLFGGRNKNFLVKASNKLILVRLVNI
nr:MAG TPA: hypothetical protein [Caudoviricetes sp.]